MAIALSNEIRALLDGPNFAHLATLMPDGSPQSAPLWVGREGDRILICTGEGSLKAKNTRRDPRVALSLIDFHDPYEEALVIEIEKARYPKLPFQHTPPK
jgi:PPOX class probable F420-dependent enzyme